MDNYDDANNGCEYTNNDAGIQEHNNGNNNELMNDGGAKDECYLNNSQHSDEFNNINHNSNNNGGGGGGSSSDKKRKHYDDNRHSGGDRSSKRGNYSDRGDRDRGDRQKVTDDTEIYFKVLVPSAVAGGVIGRGGEKIAQIQKEANVKMKMAKASDVYPGTNERPCLIVGSVKAVLQAHDFIVERMQDSRGSSEVSEDRAAQTKLLIPNNTAGLLIGKGGAYIKQIKDESGAHVQISSKSTDLPERVVTIEGETSKRERALEIVVRKIAEDPQHSSATNLSYSTMSNSSSGDRDHHYAGGRDSRGDGRDSRDSRNGSSSVGHQSLLDSLAPKCDINSAAISLAGLNSLALLIINSGGSSQMTADSLKATLRSAGCSSSSSMEIIEAITVLLNYGLISQVPALRGSLGLAGLGLNLGAALGGFGGGGGPSMQSQHGGSASGNFLSLLSNSIGKH